MSSFYGNVGVSTTGEGGITPGEVELKVADAKNHVIFSKVEPTTQKAGDVWVVIGEFDDENENNNG